MRRCEHIERNASSATLEIFYAKPPHYHVSSKLGRSKHNQCINLPRHAPLWPCHGKALSWAYPAAVLHGSWLCHTCPCFALNPNLPSPPQLCPSPALGLTLGLLSLPLPKLLVCPRLDKSHNNSGRHGYIRETP